MYNKNNINSKKKELRKKIKEAIENIPPLIRKHYDKTLCIKFKNFFESELIINKHKTLNVLCYMALPDEPDISDIINNLVKTKIVLPVSQDNYELKLKELKNNTTNGMFNIIEPTSDSPNINPNEIDLAIIPGRCFGRTGERLGRGKGYYDRFLSNCTCPTVSLCYDEQIVNHVPMDKHDIKVDYIITPSTIYYKK